MVLLGLSMVIGDFLHRRQVKWIGEAGVALVLGTVFGGLVNAGGGGSQYENWLDFKVRSLVTFGTSLPRSTINSEFITPGLQYTLVSTFRGSPYRSLRLLHAESIQSWLDQVGECIISRCVSAVFEGRAKRVLPVLLQSDFFFFALLPPIMFDAGYTMEIKP